MFCVILIGYQSVYPYHRGLYQMHWAMICLLVVVCNMACTICEGCTTDICMPLTHWGRAMHICVSKVTIIASDNGLSPGQRQAIIWNNAGILSVGLLGTTFSEILIKILTFFSRNTLESVVCEMVAILSGPQCVNTLWHSNVTWHHRSWVLVLFNDRHGKCLVVFLVRDFIHHDLS